jgi:hypothetical protein
MSAENNLIPEQKHGSESNTASSVEMGSIQHAKKAFNKLKENLLDVNHWHDFAGSLTANFRLTDAEGNKVERPVQKGDHFRIEIPGPGNEIGEGYDWVQVEEISESADGDHESLTIRVRPAANPHNDKTDTAHFFADDATSNFIVKREGNKLSASVHGRNEKPNTETESLLNKARNVAVATGAVTGVAKLQWKSLVDGLLKI